VTVRLADGKVLKIAAVILPDKFDTQLQSWDMAFADLSRNHVESRKRPFRKRDGSRASVFETL
jgi:hypothetical protein